MKYFVAYIGLPYAEGIFPDLNPTGTLEGEVTRKLGLVGLIKTTPIPETQFSESVCITDQNETVKIRHLRSDSPPLVETLPQLPGFEELVLGQFTKILEANPTLDITYQLVSSYKELMQARQLRLSTSEL